MGALAYGREDWWSVREEVERERQAVDHSTLSHRRVVAIASDSAFSLPALLGRGSLARSHALVNSKVFETCTYFSLSRSQTSCAPLPAHVCPLYLGI
jgi:hypothetical protein